MDNLKCIWNRKIWSIIVPVNSQVPPSPVRRNSTLNTDLYWFAFIQNIQLLVMLSIFLSLTKRPISSAGEIPKYFKT